MSTKRLTGAVPRMTHLANGLNEIFNSPFEPDYFYNIVLEIKNVGILAEAWEVIEPRQRGLI